MVYITPGDLGWRPYFNSWLQRYMMQFLRQEQLDFLVNLFEIFVDLAFEKLEHHREKELMPTYPSQNVRCLCNFLEYFIRDDRLQTEEKKLVWQKHLNCTFAFSMIWGFGASFGSSAHRYLDTIFRDFFGKL